MNGSSEGTPARRPLSITLLLMVALLGLFVWRSGKLGPPELLPADQMIVAEPVSPDTFAPREGYFSPEIDATTLDGNHVRLSEMRGRAVFLNFWAPWCRPCREEMASIGRLAEAAPPSVEILTVAVDANAREVARFVEKHKVGFPVVHDADRELGTAFEIAGIPTTLLLDGRGLVVKRIAGPRAWDHPQFRDWLKGLAAGTAQ